MNKLIWKLLRCHISIGQLTGFFIASLFGTTIVLLSIQFYQDISPAFSQEESFLKNDYIVVTKRISTLGGLTGRSNGFTTKEVEELQKQDFVLDIGSFTPSLFKVTAGVSVPQSGMNLSTEMFFEAVPDKFVDIDLQKWRYHEDNRTIPIIIPRNYLNLYNFGFAQSRNLPKLSDGLMSMIQLNITLRGNGQVEQYKGNIIGFSNRLNTILVPQSFIEQANQTFAPGREAKPSRLIVEIKNPADKTITNYLNNHKFETEGNNLDAGKATYFLRLIIGIVLAIGLTICMLSLYILMLSIYLLLQKNSQKLENLLLIGYSTRQVALPYHLLTGGLNLLVNTFAILLVIGCRKFYIKPLQEIMTLSNNNDTIFIFIAGIALFITVTALNVWTIQKKITSILSKGKELKG